MLLKLGQIEHAISLADAGAFLLLGTLLVVLFATRLMLAERGEEERPSIGGSHIAVAKTLRITGTKKNWSITCPAWKIGDGTPRTHQGKHRTRACWSQLTTGDHGSPSVLAACGPCMARWHTAPEAVVGQSR